MSFETAHAILPWTIIGYGLICVFVGYVAGSKRTFASLRYCSEPLFETIRTMLPFYGKPEMFR